MAHCIPREGQNTRGGHGFLRPQKGVQEDITEDPRKDIEDFRGHLAPGHPEENLTT